MGSDRSKGTPKAPRPQKVDWSKLIMNPQMFATGLADVSGIRVLVFAGIMNTEGRHGVHLR